MEKMKKCDACGAEIAKSAKSCPQCGAKNKKPVFKKWWFWVIIVLVAIGAAAGSGGDNEDVTSSADADQPEVMQQEQAEEPKPEPTAVTVDDLVDALNANALNASNTYKGAYVELTGKLSNIDSSGKYFSLAPIDEEFSFDTILCNINKDHLDAVSQFTTGQNVTVIGTITDVGEVLGYTLTVEIIK